MAMTGDGNKVLPDYTEAVELVPDGACRESMEWLYGQSFPSAEAAWIACPNGEWMEWVVEEMLERLGLVESPLPMAVRLRQALRTARDEDQGEDAYDFACLIRQHVNWQDLYVLLKELRAEWDELNRDKEFYYR